MSIYKKRSYSGNYRKIYEQSYGPIPKDEYGRSYDIHHIDGDHTNNDASNLKAVSIQEHYNIHYEQGDWGACLVMSERMNMGPEEKSLLAILNVNNMISNGTHPWLGDGSFQRSVQQQRINDGSHHLLRRLDGTSVTSDRVKDGSHHLLFQNNLRSDKNKYHFINKITGEEIIVTRNDFVKKYKVNEGNLSEVIKGNRKSVNGWKIIREIASSSFLL
jgi:hypothetical protein